MTLLVLQVIDAVSESTLTSQLSPVWVGPCDIATGEYELIFPATLSPLGIHGYQILTSASDHAVQASVFTINCPDTITRCVSVCLSVCMNVMCLSVS